MSKPLIEHRDIDRATNKVVAAKKRADAAVLAFGAGTGTMRAATAAVRKWERAKRDLVRTMTRILGPLRDVRTKA